MQLHKYLSHLLFFGMNIMLSIALGVIGSYTIFFIWISERIDERKNVNWHYVWTKLFFVIERDNGFKTFWVVSIGTFLLFYILKFAFRSKETKKIIIDKIDWEES